MWVGLIELAGVLEIEAETGCTSRRCVLLRPSGSSVICVAPSVKAEGSLPEPVISLRVAVDGPSRGAATRASAITVKVLTQHRPSGLNKPQLASMPYLSDPHHISRFEPGLGSQHQNAMHADCRRNRKD